jgi:DNA replication and repair protein RecF
MHKKAPVIVCSEIKLKNFRCFESVVFTIEQPIVLFEGINGAGKSSLLEAFYYACYLRSFRTHVPKELIRFGQDSFFVRLQLSGIADFREIQVGFSQDKRSVKIDNKNISSYKELMAHYRVISLIEDDLALIKGGPQERRAFIDHALLLENTDYGTALKEFKVVLNNRNNLILSMARPGISIDTSLDSNYMIWTEKLWLYSCQIQAKRAELLNKLIQEVNTLMGDYFDNQYVVTGSYQARKMESQENFSAFLAANSGMIEYERRFKRSYFGAHLDDFTLLLEHRETKRLASRGQQKLLLLLLKIAQARLIVAQHGPIIFLLDDFMTDFDNTKVEQLLSLLGDLGSQLLFSVPTSGSALGELIQARGGQVIALGETGRTQSMQATVLASNSSTDGEHTHRIKGPTLGMF